MIYAHDSLKSNVSGCQTNYEQDPLIAVLLDLWNQESNKIHREDPGWKSSKMNKGKEIKDVSFIFCYLLKKKRKN